MHIHSRIRGVTATLFFWATGFVSSTTTVSAAAPEPIAAKTNLTTVAPASGETKSGTVENSVVKVFSTMRYPDFYKPWTKQAPSESTGSGVVIEGKRILSN